MSELYKLFLYLSLVKWDQVTKQVGHDIFKSASMEDSDQPEHQHNQTDLSLHCGVQIIWFDFYALAHIINLSLVLGLVMGKPDFVACQQQRHRSAYACMECSQLSKSMVVEVAVQ